MRFDRDTSRPTAGLSRATQWKFIAMICGIGVLIALFDTVLDRPSQELASSSTSTGTGSRPKPETVDLGLLTAEEYNTFEDNTVGMSRAEGVAFFKAIRELEKIRNATLDRIARNDVVHSVLMADAEMYRGQLVRLKGQIRRLTERPVPSDVTGMDGLLEGWVFTPDSDVQPYRVVTLLADEQIPRGEQFDPVPVELVGVFIRREAYASQKGTSVAPLLIAKRIGYRVVAPPSESDRLTPMLAGAVCLAMSAILYAFMTTMWRQQRRRIEFRIATDREAGPGDIESESPGEFLASLELKADSEGTEQWDGGVEAK